MLIVLVVLLYYIFIVFRGKREGQRQRERENPKQAAHTAWSQPWSSIP